MYITIIPEKVELRNTRTIDLGKGGKSLRSPSIISLNFWVAALSYIGFSVTGNNNHLSHLMTKSTPEDHWSCIAHLSAEAILKSAVTEGKKLNLSDLDQGQWMTLTFGTHKASCAHLVDCIYQLFISQTTLVSEKSIVLTFSHTKA